MLSKAKEPCSQPMELVVSSELRDTLYVHMYLAGKRSMLQVEGFGSNQTVKPRLNDLNGSVQVHIFVNDLVQFGGEWFDAFIIVTVSSLNYLMD
mgnify:CR=1 FL=1